MKELAKSDPDPKEIARLSDALLDNATDSVHFTVDAHKQTWVGAVGKQEATLSELIKNTYDADATPVDIDYENFNKVSKNIKITDNGLGMNVQTIRNSWRILSTNDKGEKYSIREIQATSSRAKGHWLSCDKTIGSMPHFGDGTGGDGPRNLS